MKLTIIQIMEEKPPSKNFSLKDLPGASKIDVVSRCILSIFPNNIEQLDISFQAIFSKTDIHVLTVNELPLIDETYDEISVASMIKEAIQNTESSNGDISWASVVDFQQYIFSVVSNHQATYYLHENGQSIEEIKDVLLQEESLCFIIGGRHDISQEHEKILDSFGAQQISLGKKIYLASTCITSILFELEKQFEH